MKFHFSWQAQLSVIMPKILVSVQIVLLFLLAVACGDTQQPASNSNTAAEKVCDPISDTPTEAYKRLFSAVKEKNVENIKSSISKKTQELAAFTAERQKSPIEKVYENGFTGTTFSPTLPEIRDERVKGCWAAVEVRNSKDQRWEDLPYVQEDGVWKLAFGEAFAGSYKSPGKGRDQIENEAANVARGNQPPPNMMPSNMMNANVNSSPAPKYDGPQVEPLPKKK